MSNDPETPSNMDAEHGFATNRLVVRRWVAEDEAEVLRLYGDPEVVRWVEDGSALSPADARRWMDVTRANYATRGSGMMAVDLRETSETIGFGGIFHPGGRPEPEVKYAFRTAVWGRGLATEFVLGLVAYAWDVLALPRLEATVAAGNAASARMLEKSGFAF